MLQHHMDRVRKNWWIEQNQWEEYLSKRWWQHQFSSFYRISLLLWRQQWVSAVWSVLTVSLRFSSRRFCSACFSLLSFRCVRQRRRGNGTNEKNIIIIITLNRSNKFGRKISMGNVSPSVCRSFPDQEYIPLPSPRSWQRTNIFSKDLTCTRPSIDGTNDTRDSPTK